MAVLKKYISKQGKGFKVSPHFTLGEIASKDGADKVLYAEETLAMLEELRSVVGGDEYEVKILVNSFYRSEAHNKKVGGASNSTHCKGYAADVKVKKQGEYIPAKLLCCLAQSMGFKGIGYINSNSVHLDMYGRIYRGDETKGYGNNVKNDFYSYFKVSKADVEALKSGKPAKKEEPVAKVEDDEMIYKDITEVPEEWRASVQLRLDHGWDECKDMPESLVRGWVAEDRENPYIVDIGDVPTWAVPEVQALIDKGNIKGNGVEQIGKRWNVLQGLIMAERD